MSDFVCTKRKVLEHVFIAVSILEFIFAGTLYQNICIFDWNIFISKNLYKSPVDKIKTI